MAHHTSRLATLRMACAIFSKDWQ